MKKNFFIKICGISSLLSFESVVSSHPTAIGLIFVPGTTREVTILLGTKIAARARANKVKVVAVFQNQSLKFIREVISTIRPHFVQLHGNESVEFCESIRIPVIKTIKPGENIAETKKEMTAYKNVVKYFLLDRPKQGQGEMLQSKVVRELARDFPVLLAGGLDSKNVRPLLAEVSNVVEGMDVSSGVEGERGGPGQKDPRLVRTFVKTIQEFLDQNENNV
jgi:phosphoribosylanthranilate isomerase